MPAVAKPNTPLVTLVKPEPRKEKVADLEAVRLLVEALEVTARLVVVALVAVALPVMFKLPEIVEEAVEISPATLTSVVVAEIPEAGCVHAS